MPAKSLNMASSLFIILASVTWKVDTFRFVNIVLLERRLWNIDWSLSKI